MDGPGDYTGRVVHAETPIVEQLFHALATVRGREPAMEAIARVREGSGVTPHSLRHALDRVRSDRDATRTWVWPTLVAVRETVDSLDGAIDRALIATAESAVRDTLARDLLAAGSDHPRALRSLEIMAQRLGPPASRAHATLVDLLRTHALGDARVAVYRFLVTRGVDVRTPLADDTTLRPHERIDVLAAFASRRADAGRLRPVSFTREPLAELARALPNWPEHATHPRQLFYAFRRESGITDRSIYLATLRVADGWPLPSDVRAQLERERSGEPERLSARPLGGGRFACARCGAPRVTAVATRVLEADDPLRGVETEYRCAGCGVAYFTMWDLERVEASAVPVGWSET
jgi:hypothetical protein